MLILKCCRPCCQPQCSTKIDKIDNSVSHWNKWVLLMWATQYKRSKYLHFFSFNSKFSPVFFQIWWFFETEVSKISKRSSFTFVSCVFVVKFAWKWWFFKNLVKPGEFSNITRFSPSFEKSPGFHLEYYQVFLKLWWNFGDFFLKILLWCACILFVENFETCVLDSRIYLQKACWVLELKLLGENASSALSLTPKQLNICNVCTFRSARKFRGVCSVPSGPAIRRQEVPTNCQETRLGWKRKENH